MIYETIKILSKKKGLSINQLEKTLGVSKGSLCRIDTNRPSIDRLQRIADFFEVSLDYLMTGNEVQEDDNSLTARDRRDIAKDVENIMGKLNSGESGPASYDGEELDSEAAELFRDELELALKRLKVINKEKYTNKRYKK